MRKQALIVEDEHLVREVLAVQLQQAGFDIVSADDGESGLLQLSSGRPLDVVLVDLVMPKMSGLALLKIMREMPTAVRYVPALMITGHTDKSLIRKAVELGANDFLIKPWSLEDLTQKVASVLLPRLEFEEIKSVIGRLHVEDRELLKSVAHPEYREETHRSFAVTIGSDRYCFVVRRGAKVSSIATMSAGEAASLLTVFCRRKNKWAYCWPDMSVSSESKNDPPVAVSA